MANSQLFTKKHKPSPYHRQLIFEVDLHTLPHQVVTFQLNANTEI